VAQFPATDSGLPGIGRIPWGSHICQFFRRREDLVECLVPYFRAGLENNERCLWVTGDPFRAQEATIELDRSMRGLSGHLDQGRIRIVDSDLWYTGLTQPTNPTVIEAWLREEREAAVAGFTGLRVAGNLSFLKPEELPSFLEYEKAVDRIFPRRQIIALCSYELGNCDSGSVSGILQAHRYALGRKHRSWALAETVRGMDSSPPES
jgi:hypothetical protein